MNTNIFIINTDTCFGIGCPINDLKGYNKIYSIKKRSYDKPISVMVEDLNWLQKNTNLNKDQIDFLKNYERPFTILCDSKNLKLWLNYEDENGEGFINRDQYKLIAFRITHTPEQKKLIKEFGPIFLSSANLSGKPEIYDEKVLKDEFKYYLDNKIISYIKSLPIFSKIKLKSSDIFEFVGNSIDIKYLRKE